MKPRKIIAMAGMVGIIAGLVSSCVKKLGKETAVENIQFNNSAILQIYNASVPAAATTTARTYAFVDQKVITGAAIAYGSSFPSATSGFALTAGFREFLIKDTLTTSANIQPPLSFAEDLQAGKYYTIFLYDTVNAIKKKTVFTNIIIPVDTTARVRFANFAYHNAANGGISIFSKLRNEFVVTGLMHTQVTDFIAYNSRVADSLFVTETGNASNRLDTLVFTPTRLRSYTLVFRGRWRTNEAGGAANPRVLAVFANN